MREPESVRPPQVLIVIAGHLFRHNSQTAPDPEKHILASAAGQRILHLPPDLLKIGHMAVLIRPIIPQGGQDLGVRADRAIPVNEIGEQLRGLGGGKNKLSALPVQEHLEITEAPDKKTGAFRCSRLFHAFRRKLWNAHGSSRSCRGARKPQLCHGELLPDLFGSHRLCHISPRMDPEGILHIILMSRGEDHLDPGIFLQEQLRQADTVHAPHGDIQESDLRSLLPREFRRLDRAAKSAYGTFSVSLGNCLHQGFQGKFLVIHRQDLHPKASSPVTVSQFSIIAPVGNLENVFSFPAVLQVPLR